MKKNSEWILPLVSFVALVLVNLISLHAFFRLDLTRDKKFTLSKASVETMKGLKDTLTVSAYFSDDLPVPYSQHARYVRDLLEEYLAASDGLFAFEFRDPKGQETVEDKAKKKDMKRDIFGRLVREATSVENELAELGIAPVEIRVIEGDEQKTQKAYMGLVVRFQEKYEVIPVVEVVDLEKTLTGLMRKLTRTSMPKVGLLKDDANIEKVSFELKKNVELVPINTELELEGLDALLVVGASKYLTATGVKKLQDFIDQGKSVALLLDRYPVDPTTFELKPINYSEDIFGLIKNYGISIEQALVADASCASLNVQDNSSGFAFLVPIKYPFVPELLNLSFQSPITKGLSEVILPFVSPIELGDKANSKTQVLAQSSKVSWLEKTPLNINPQRDWNATQIIPDGPYNLLVESLIEGQSKKSRLIVMGSSAFLWDEFLSEPNLILALNMVDWLVLDSALLAMRTKDIGDTPFDAELSDRTKQIIKYGNILGVPLLLVLYGLIRWRMRESKRRKIRA